MCNETNWNASESKDLSGSKNRHRVFPHTYLWHVTIHLLNISPEFKDLQPECLEIFLNRNFFLMFPKRSRMPGAQKFSASVLKDWNSHPMESVRINFTPDRNESIFLEVKNYHGRELSKGDGNLCKTFLQEVEGLIQWWTAWEGWQGEGGWSPRWNLKSTANLEVVFVVWTNRSVFRNINQTQYRNVFGKPPKDLWFHLVACYLVCASI